MRAHGCCRPSSTIRSVNPGCGAWPEVTCHPRASLGDSPVCAKIIRNSLRSALTTTGTITGWGKSSGHEGGDHRAARNGDQRAAARGGSQAFVSDLARGLAGRGNDVYVYAASGSAIPGVKVIDTGIDPESLAATLYHAAASTRPNMGAAEAAFASVYAQVRGNRYDVVHNHAFDAPAITLATKLGAPVVHTLHLPPDQAMAAALRQAGQGGEPPAVATVSASQARAWRQVAHVDAILRPLVPTALIHWSRRAGVGAVFGGRLSPEKGAAEAIDIAHAAGVESTSTATPTTPITPGKRSVHVEACQA